MTLPHIIRVIGVPRSGTAFASMLLQLYPDCNAYHEMAAYDKNWKKVICENDADYVADCNTYGFLPEAFIPSSVNIFLNRDKWESRRSAEVALGLRLDEHKFGELHSLANMWAIRHDAVILDQGEIFTMEGMEKLWTAAFGEFIHFPHTKAAQLLRLNIQVNEPKKMVYEGRVFEV